MKKITESIILFILILVGFIIILRANLLTGHGEQQFVELADSFIHKRLYIPVSAEYVRDVSIWQGKYYWPLGPFPAVLLIPFVSIWGIHVNQGQVQFLLILLIFFLLFKIAQKITSNIKVSLWLSTGYIFSSAFIGIAILPLAWQFAQVVGTSLIFFALYEYLHKRRLIIIGIIIGFAAATRLNLIVASVFFFLEIIFSKNTLKVKIEQIAQMLVPIAVCIACLLVYNRLRFHNFLDQGYSLQNLTIPDLIANRSFGLWSFIHFPANLYYFFFNGPQAIFIPGTKVLKFPYIKPDAWGMSIIFTSPIFLWLSSIDIKKKIIINALITSGVLAFVISGYYGIGFAQYGYRYALDFYPFLFFMLCYVIKQRMSYLLKAVIFLSFCFNWYLLSFPY